MTLKEVILNNRFRYKQIFNFIFKEYLQDKSHEQVSKIDLNFYGLWNRCLEECAKTLKKTYRGCIFLNEIIDDLEEGSKPFIDVAVYNVETESLEPIDFTPLPKILNLKIQSPKNLEEIEIISHILYEIFLFGEKDEAYEKKEKNRKKLWKEIEKDIKDIYNLGDD